MVVYPFGDIRVQVEMRAHCSSSHSCNDDLQDVGGRHLQQACQSVASEATAKGDGMLSRTAGGKFPCSAREATRAVSLAEVFSTL